MSLLLDTHVALWWLEAPERLSEAARDALSMPGTRVFVSAVSAWEIGIKQSIGKLHTRANLDAHWTDEGFTPLAITWRHGLEVAALPLLHRDPFDRLLVAQARLERLTLVTRDAALAAYGVDVLAA